MAAPRGRVKRDRFNPATRLVRGGRIPYARDHSLPDPTPGGGETQAEMAERTTRRVFMRQAGAGASSLLLSGCSQRVVRMAGTLPVSGPRPVIAGDDVLLGLYPRDANPDAVAAVRDACRRLDWSWLNRGDTVFVKLSCNSSHPHPATTSPASVRAVVAELQERGAGRILVGDQSGAGYVRLAAGERRFSSTREQARANGLLAAMTDSGAEPYFFDDQGYERGYYRADLPLEHPHWHQPLYLARIIREVDHVIYLPRLSSHVLAGYTHGHKLAVGWLRDDSRFQMHHEAASFHEKFVEINHVPELAGRLRLVLTLAGQALLSVGPHEGSIGRCDSWMVIASASLPRHDALAVACLAYLDRRTPPQKLHIIPPPYGAFSNASNWLYVSRIVPDRTGIPWGQPDCWRYQPLPTHNYTQSLSHDRALAHAFRLAGGSPARIPVRLAGCEPVADLRSFIAAWSGQVLAAEA